MKNYKKSIESISKSLTQVQMIKKYLIITDYYYGFIISFIISTISLIIVII